MEGQRQGLEQQAASLEGTEGARVRVLLLYARARAQERLETGGLQPLFADDPLLEKVVRQLSPDSFRLVERYWCVVFQSVFEAKDAPKKKTSKQTRKGEGNSLLMGA